MLISSNTTWSAGQVVTLTGAVQIAPGATLTIAPGAIVNGNGHAIEAMGRLIANGTANEHVSFNNVAIRYGASTSSAPGYINVSFADISGGTFLSPTGNGGYGSFSLTDSAIKGLQSYIYAWYPTQDSFIERNVFYRSGGISSGVSDGDDLFIRNNVFAEQTTPYAVENWATYSGTKVVVSSNSFLSTDRIALSVKDGYDSAALSASDNFFTTTNPVVIDAMIRDRTDSLSYASVIQPTATAQPNPNTPSFTIPDTSAPVLTFSVSGGPTRSNVQAVSGTIGTEDAGRTVTILDGTTVIGSAIAGQDGRWRAGVTLTGDGVHTLTARATDLAGNTGTSATVTYTLDTAAPTPAITPITGPVNSRAQTISGTVGIEDAGRTVTVYDGAAIVGSATVGATGKWSAFVTLPYIEGAHTLTARATDFAGNTGTSAPVTLVLDTVAPVVTMTTPDGVVRSSFQTITGTVGLADAGRTVTIYDSLDPIATTVSGANGRWSVGVTLVGEGGHALTASVTDLAGNKGVSPFLAYVVLDASAPSLAITSPGGLSNKAIQTVSGTIGTRDAGQVVTILDGTRPVGTALSGPDGRWSADVALVGDGAHSLAARATDLAGNAGASAAVTFTLDTAAPAVAITSAGITTHKPGQAIAGTVGDAGATVTIWDGSTAIGTAVSDAGGVWRAAVTLGGDGMHGLVARATDKAGNTGASAAVTFTLDTTPPKAFGELAYDLGSTGGQVYALYDAVLGRVPDTLGLQHWAARLDDGASLVEVGSALLGSGEGQALFGNRADAAFLARLYEVALDRAPDAAGQATWATALANGTSRAEVATSFAMSDEHAALLKPALGEGIFVPDETASTIARLYHGVLGRAPDEAGLVNWSERAESGLAFADIANAFLRSAEGQAQTGALTNPAFVEFLYDHALGRAADAAGLTGWTKLIDTGGATRADVALGFAQSVEAQAHLLSSIEAGWHLA